MNDVRNKVFKKTLWAYLNGYDFIINEGSSGSGKNYSILQVLNEVAKVQCKEIEVIGVSVNHLKNGALRDFKSILTNAGEWSDANWNASDKQYEYPSGAFMKFQSFDKIGKATGPRRDIVYINEWIYHKYSILSQIFIRTRDCVMGDHNPIKRFWLHEKYPHFDNNELRRQMYEANPDKEIKTYYIHSTYKDNPNNPRKSTIEIERLKETDPELYKIYGLGKLGALQGLVFPAWEIVDSIPETAQSLGIWLDWGYSNSPTAIGRLLISEGDLYCYEYVYETGLTVLRNSDNPQQQNIQQKLEENNIEKKDVIYADVEDPRGITELRMAGYNVQGAPKFKGSVIQGILLLKRFKVFILKTSKNIISERDNYIWKVDSEEKPTNEPVKAYDHHMDGIRGVALANNFRGLMK